MFGLKPLVSRMAESLILGCKAAGMEIAITEGYRTLERQAELYAQGRTEPGKIVTNAKPGYSLHNYGVAFDIVFVVNGKRTYTGDWDKVGDIGKKLGLDWGGSWTSFKDRPHFQYLAFYTLSDFINKKIDESRFS